MIFNGQSRAEVKKVEKHWKSNLILRLIIFVLATIDCFIFGLMPLTMQDSFMWCAYIALVPSGIWALMVIIFRLCRVAPIHPGVIVGFELTLFVAYSCIQAFVYIQVIQVAPFLQALDFDPIYVPGAAWAANLYASLAMSVITILHFYLFVRACIDTSRRRSHEIATRAAAIAAQMVKNMESRGTFYRRDSDASYGFRPFEAEEAGHIIGLEELQHNTGLAPLRTSRMSQISDVRSARTGRTRFSEARTQYSHTRSMSVPIPTSPMSLRTARTDEPSLFRLER